MKIERNQKGQFIKGNKSVLGKHWKIKDTSKMSKCRIGKKLSEIGRKHLSEALKGRKFTEEHKRKLSLLHKGKTTWNKGKKCPEISLRMKGNKNSPKGEKNHLWKGGITPATKKIRDSEKYQEWRQSVFIRDNFTCQKCKEKGGRLHAHHIKPFHKFIEEIKLNLPLLDLFTAAMLYTPLWNINNGITYCKKCHKKKHKRR